ncbi:hypothetical protein IM697_37265 [Streptomyces ferrugineus]|uniref:Uncharacterized protein n=1 Tax=Streptomyces ferrugineus TaxID=1413221 RepID=A0A7M2T242_9ACTN|nr:hypothetical protein [Streptomyces ferrugineus]QOV41591.1 hypothetical protein IM697_37265 [Streptomyces ferrugineus]
MRGGSTGLRASRPAASFSAAWSVLRAQFRTNRDGRRAQRERRKIEAEFGLRRPKSGDLTAPRTPSRRTQPRRVFQLGRARKAITSLRATGAAELARRAREAPA